MSDYFHHQLIQSELLGSHRKYHFFLQWRQKQPVRLQMIILCAATRFVRAVRRSHRVIAFARAFRRGCKSQHRVKFGFYRFVLQKQVCAKSQHLQENVKDQMADGERRFI